MYSRSSGIYAIVNRTNGKLYIGQAQDINRRLIEHKSTLINKRCDSHILQNAWNKYGKDNFSFCIIEECSIEKLDEKEIYYIKILHSHKTDWGYNISLGGDNNQRGRKPTPEQLKKMSIRMSGSRNPMYGKSGKDAPNFGKSFSEEHKRKIGEAQLGAKNHMYGRRYSEEELINRGKKQIGKKQFDASSQYIGVLKFNGYKGKVYWRVEFQENHIRTRLNRYYRTEMEAALAHDKYIMEHKIDRPLNFQNISV